MQQLCNRRINYYFAAITGYTAKMARIMQGCYANSHNAEFKARLSHYIFPGHLAMCKAFLQFSKIEQECTVEHILQYVQ